MGTTIKTRRGGIRAILACITTFIFAAAMARADGVLGDWDMKLDYQGNLIPAKLHFEMKDGALAGMWSSQRGENVLTKIKCEGNKITFTRTVKFQDQTFDLDYAGTVEGDKITGKFTTPMGDMEANGARVAAAAPKPDAPKPAEAPKADAAKPAEVKPGLPGVWELTVDSQLGVNKRKLTIDDKMNGTYEADYGKFPAKNMKCDAGKLSFDLDLKVNDQALALKFDGKVDGTSLTGTFNSDSGAAAKITGKKVAELAGAAPAPAAPAMEILTGPVNLAGGWKMTVQTPDGATNEGEIEIKSGDGGKLSASLTTELGKIEVTAINVDGNKVDFAAQVDFGGTMVPISFKGSSGGDKIKGIVKLNFEGQEMELPLEGSRKKGLSGPIDLPGKWHLEVQTPEGAASQADVVIAAGEGGKFSGQLTTELGDAKIDSITLQGNALSFKTQVEFNGAQVPLEFKGSAAGDKIEGSVKVSLEGQDMELPLKGTKTPAAKPAASAPPAAPAASASAGCCKKPNCGPGCKGSAGCKGCCEAA